MANNIEDLKAKSRAARSRISGTYGVAKPQDSGDPKVALTALFSEVTSARQDVSDSLLDLISLRVSAYESVLSGYIASFYSRAMVSNVEAVETLFDALEVVSSSEFSENLDAAVFVIENDYNERTLSAIASYFESKFEEIVSIAYPEGDVEVTYDAANNRILEDGSPVVNPEASENKLYFLLKILGLLKSISNEEMQTDISSLKEYAVSHDSPGSFPYKIRSIISSRISVIADLISSKSFMDSVRSQQDPSYSPEHDQEVNSAMVKVKEITEIISTLDPQGVEAARANGSIDKLSAYVSQMSSSSDDLVVGSISAITNLENFIEDYQPFVRLPESENLAIREAISICEGARESYASYSEQFQTGLFVTPFYDGPSNGDGRKNFSDWVDLVTTSSGGLRPVVDGDNFEMLLLYMGTAGRDFLSEDSYRAISNRAISTLYAKGLIRSDQLKSSFALAFSDEKSLFEDSGVRLSPSPGDDQLPFAAKAFLPGMEVLDYISFSDAMEFDSVTPDADEVSLRNTVRVAIIESFGRIRKESLAKAIRDSIAAISSWSRESLKGLYFEICFKEAIEEFRDYLDGLEDYSSETRIDITTKNAIDAYTSAETAPSIADLEGWLEKYITSHLAIYGSATSGDLVEHALLPGSTLKNLLITA